LRSGSSTPERVLWSHLRARQTGGLKFRRQHAIGPYVADFYCAQAKLVVEIDGLVHESRAERDAARDGWMSERGIRVVRLSASDVARDRDAVLRLILKKAEEGE